MNKKLIFLVMLVSLLAFNLVFVSCGKSLNGTWVVEGQENNGIQFSGKNFSLNTNPGARSNFLGDAMTKVQDGTYSISDDKLELSYSDGKVEVHSFSRTENTITIGTTRLTLKK